jgi:hypothetical protein
MTYVDVVLRVQQRSSRRNSPVPVAQGLDDHELAAFLRAGLENLRIAMQKNDDTAKRKEHRHHTDSNVSVHLPPTHTPTLELLTM